MSDGLNFASLEEALFLVATTEVGDLRALLVRFNDELVVLDKELIRIRKEVTEFKDCFPYIKDINVPHVNANALEYSIRESLKILTEQGNEFETRIYKVSCAVGILYAILRDVRS